MKKVGMMSTLNIRKKHLIDGGGQGTVFEAEVEGTGEKVALKELKVDPIDGITQESRERFSREVRCQSKLTHPNIVKIIAQNNTDTPPWYIMPWAENTLRAKLKNAQPGGLPEREALEIFTQIMDATEYAHSEGVLHRDLKPENILFIGGVPQVSDFGLSKQVESMSTSLTMTNQGMGTRAYCAPEQSVNAREADRRADIYSLGKMFYEMITGKFPFPGIDLDLLPAKYHFIIEKAVEHDPERRYSSVAQIGQELNLFSDDEDSFQMPTEAAKGLVEKIASGDDAFVVELNNLLLRNVDDLHLYTQFVPLMPVNVLTAYAKIEPNGLRSLIFAFDKYAEGSHPFSYTDTIALFLERVFYLLDDRKVRSLILTRVLVLGKEHNRFFVRDKFIKIVRTACETDAGATLVARVLSDNPGYKSFVDEHLRASISLPPIIHNVL